MKTYYARIPRTGWFVRVPRWLYNRWPWCGVVQMPNHPRTGELVRYRLHEANVQLAIRKASAGNIKPHELRHAYDTHCLNQGTNPRAIQQAMGHKSLETTMGYLHAEAMSVPSPLEHCHVTSTLQPLNS